MNLLFRRGQQDSQFFSLVPLRIGSGVIFQLHAELELDDVEQELMAKFRFADTPLVVSDPIDDLKQAFRPALLLGIVSFVVLWFFTSWAMSAFFSFIVVLTMTVVYFRTLREQILVRDLLDGGRLFFCDSIVALIHKEAYLETMAAYLRQVLESAKNWDDRERLVIEPLDKLSAKQAVLRGRFAA